MDEHSSYRIVVRGEVSPNWHDWFDALAVEVATGTGGAPVTTFSGPIADQAALRGMLCRLWDLNLTVLSVVRLDATGLEELQNE